MAHKDRRYNVNPEFTGHESGKKQFVIRFCGDFVSSHSKRDEAEKEIARWKSTGTVPHIGKQWDNLVEPV
ncbi:hypothetical protein [Yersinia phage fHe-Yen9-04]|uniref:Uncharacterized protein n=1 Tax=Yersinia phage fHe-Yen9-04 TaxID=2052742 RepID=A0A2C9CWS1_9CAUD|nr:hypothetical protein FDJ41_gp010 [Yersinia phage fHe-Yen9-04]SOK58287.1 hypothetical protein [Yersinia phage fHe-Yen9-04]VUE36056.1 hypothetical protein [Yersinia phage fHe-Yen9-04]